MQSSLVFFSSHVYHLGRQRSIHFWSSFSGCQSPPVLVWGWVLQEWGCCTVQAQGRASVQAQVVGLV